LTILIEGCDEMSAKRTLEKLIKEIKRDNTPSNLHTWQNIWCELDYGQKNEFCSTEGWEYVSKFLELLSTEKLTLEGIGYIFEYILSIARTSESEDYPAPINFDISAICDILLDQKKNLNELERYNRVITMPIFPVPMAFWTFLMIDSKYKEMIVKESTTAERLDNIAETREQIFSKFANLDTGNLFYDDLDSFFGLFSSNFPKEYEQLVVDVPRDKRKQAKEKIFERFSRVLDNDRNRAVRLKIISKGVRILDLMNNLQAIEVLVQFVKPNLAPGTYELEDRVTEFTLKSIKSLIKYASDKFSHQEYYKRNPTKLNSKQRSKISETMLTGHINDNCSELIVYCNCSLDSRELDLEDFSGNTKKRRALRDSFFDDEISDTEFARLLELIPEDPECSVCGYYTDKAHICADCDTLICERCAKKPEEKLGNREIALEIIRYLECEKTIRSVIHFIDSKYTNEVSIILKMMEDYWKPDYLGKVIDLTKSTDISISMQAIRIIGNHGDKEQVELLLELLEKYAKLQGKGSKRARDSVEKALFDLRAYAHDDLIHISAEKFHNKGFLNAIDRIIKKIARIQDGRTKSPNDWSDFNEWRYNKGEEENQSYLPAILTNDVISKIIDRQPIEFIQLLEVDGIGPYKVAKYGHEFLGIIRKNQLDIDSSQYLLPPWSFPNEMDEWLDTILVHVDISEWEKLEDGNQQSGFLKMKNCHTKSQLRELSVAEYEQFEDNKDILYSILDWRLKYKSGVEKAGKSRGVRYIIVN
jgi:hypothetical protein